MASCADPTRPPCAQTFFTAPQLPFEGVFTDEEVQQVLQEEQVAFGQEPDAIWTPELVLWTWLHQVLSADQSCAAAVMRTITLLLAAGREPCSANTGAYCKARAKLPEDVFRKLAQRTAANLEQQAPADWRWKGRHVFVPDGSTFTMPDTDENQQAFPQNPTQEEGLGFPIARMVTVFSLATACVLAAAYGPYQGKETGETALFRDLLAELPPEGVLLADRYYCSYFLIVLAQQHGWRVVLRQHQRRRTDFRRGRRLGRHDHVVSWPRPARPEWMDEETYAQMPESLELREVRIEVRHPGFRVRSLVVVTDFLKPREVSREELGELYYRRWSAELNLRYLKQGLQLDPLRCRSPQMIAKEYWAHLCAYNLLRKIAAQAALWGECCPWQLSFKATQEAVREVRVLLAIMPAASAAVLAGWLLAAVVQREVGRRPGRFEPRKIKRRQHRYDLLTRPRAEEKAAILAGLA
jgi:hypothetical protein